MSDTLKRIFFAPAAVMDLWLYILIGALTFIYGSLSSDEAAKYIPGLWLFISKTFVGGTNAGLLAAKMYRSTGFSDHLKKKEAETSFTARPAP